MALRPAFTPVLVFMFGSFLFDLDSPGFHTGLHFQRASEVAKKSGLRNVPVCFFHLQLLSAYSMSTVANE